MHGIATIAISALALTSTVLGAALPKPQWEDVDLPDLSDSNPIEGIVNGTNVKKGDHPWIAMITDKNNWQFCGGSIIAPNLALTAAHCVHDRTPENTFVKSRRWDKSKTTAQEGGIDFAVTKIINHPNYPKVAGNDIAILVIKQVKNYGQGIPYMNKIVEHSGQYIVAGWGATKEGGPGSNILQEVRVKEVPREECRKMYPPASIPDTVICAHYPGYDACQGDSGGPLFTAWNELSGIVSWGTGCARPDKPGVYTRVRRFEDWINGIKAQYPWK